MTRTSRDAKGSTSAAGSRNRPAAELLSHRPEVIEKFVRDRSKYEELCAEVVFILKKRIRECGIETASITSRVKTEESFREKLKRKHYTDPIQLTDLAGTRVVCLYRDDVDKVIDIIRADFTVVEHTNKFDELGVNKFGYGAQHLLVQLGKSSSGARYDDLKELVCEVQIRTVVQDAWAIIQHHLLYKSESQMPTQLQRKLNCLAGLFETVDDQFEMIKAKRESYLNEVRHTAGTWATFLESELNLDTFKKYIVLEYPDRRVETFDGQMRLVLDGLLAAGYKTLNDLDCVMRETAVERRVLVEWIAGARSSSHGTILETPSVFEAAYALALKDPNWHELIPFAEKTQEIIRQHRELHPGPG